MSKLTKTCAVRSCNYSNGTRENVKMFRVPKDEGQMKLWKDALCFKENQKLQGLVCINHFDKKDISETKSDTRLKKNAIPIQIHSLQCEQSTSKAPALKSDQSSTINQFENSITSEIVEYECERCNINLAELDSLRTEHVQIKMEYELKISQLENRLHVLQEKLTTRTHDAQLLKKRLEYSKITKEKLKTSLNDLKKENLLSKEVLAFVQVRLSLICIIRSSIFLNFFVCVDEIGVSHLICSTYNHFTILKSNYFAQK